ncbi:MAG: hypothetical protein ABEH38_07005 [Flavobacteriales bacterium]
METDQWTWHVVINSIFGPLGGAGFRPYMEGRGGSYLEEGEEEGKKYPLFSKKLIERALVECMVWPNGIQAFLVILGCLLAAPILIWKLWSMQGVFYGILMLLIGFVIMRERLKYAQLNVYEEGREKEKERIRARSRKKPRKRKRRRR